LKRSVNRPKLRPWDCLFWIWLLRTWPHWRSALVIVKPETKDVRELIRTMSRNNSLWGAPRIHGELLKLGINVSQATDRTRNIIASHALHRMHFIPVSYYFNDTGSAPNPPLIAF
jgi:hypothetical protein